MAIHEERMAGLLVYCPCLHVRVGLEDGSTNTNLLALLTRKMEEVQIRSASQSPVMMVATEYLHKSVRSCINKWANQKQKQSPRTGDGANDDDGGCGDDGADCRERQPITATCHPYKGKRQVSYCGWWI